ncbi:hypothetical protein NE237_016241 [Protea cynaroides]|uniref:PHD-type domain-containing protein n=1 Tax=Protea cynaroides TaxID=273540 RepID=A0A9Q0QRU5_9MAGN|nr:hypothetical protein NE237_016241 [Protea cynaroides]
MISSKVVITYRRKRTSSRLEPACGTQCAYSSPSDNLATRLGQHDESRKKYSPENPKEDAGLCIKCFDLGGILLCCSSCSRTCHLQCIDPPLKHVIHEQWLCTNCTERQSARNSLQHQVSESGRQMERSGLTDEVLLATNHGDANSDKETGSSLQADACLNPGSTCKSPFPETISISQYEGSETELKTKSVCLDSSVERNGSSHCPSADMENPDSLSKDKSCLICSDELMKKKCSTPLITFCRRAKKKEVNRTDTENNSVAEDKKSAVINYCISASEVVSKHDAPLNCISVSQLRAVIASRQDPDMHHLQDEMFNEVASATSTSADGQKDSPIKCAVESSAIMDLVVNGDKQSRTTDVGVSVGEEFQSVEDVGSQGAVKPGAVLGVTTSVGHLDLSVAPPDSCGTVKGTHSELPIHPNHVTVLQGEKTKRGKGPMLLENNNKTEQEGPLSDTLAGRSSCINTEEHGNRSKDYGKASTLLPMDSSSQIQCRQKCSEDLMNEMAPLACRPLTASVDSSLAKPGCKYDSCNQVSSKSFLCPPLSLGLSLPMEPDTAVSASKDCSSMSLFPCFSRSKDIQNLLPHSVPDQSSIQRHKLMLDSIVTRARALKGNQGCWLDKFRGSATAWSDEELDSLWMGVRRHGRGNWDTMLRDPRLHFSVWRVAKDLAEQWDEEQTKLLSGMLTQPASLRISHGHTQGINNGLLSETRVASNRYGSHGMGNCMTPKSQPLMDETQLSLGNVYVQRERSCPYSLPSQYTMHHTLAENNSQDKMSSVLNRDLRNTVLQKTSDKQLQKNIRGQRNRTYPNRKRLRYRSDVSFVEQNPFDKSRSHDGEVRVTLNRALLPDHPPTGSSTSNHSLLPDHPPTGSSVTGNLPHWLREAISLPPSRPTEPALPFPVSQMGLLYNGHQHVIPPFSHPGELPLPQKNPHQGLRKNDNICKFGGHASSDIPSSNLCSTGSRFGHLSMMGTSSIMPEADNQILNGRTDLNPACLYSVGKTKDLILIDSEASSEETISDDQSGRP